LKTVRTRELHGAELDFAVALVLGLAGRLRDGQCLVDGIAFCPSTDWAVGGPLLERRRIEINPPNPQHATRQDWFARCLVSPGLSGLAFGTGPTPLEAAMRALVASEFPLSIELPTHGWT
jgi:hypothetical protein